MFKNSQNTNKQDSGKIDGITIPEEGLVVEIRGVPDLMNGPYRLMPNNSLKRIDSNDRI